MNLAKEEGAISVIKGSSWIYMTEMRKYWEYEKDMKSKFGDMAFEEYVAYSKEKNPDRAIFNNEAKDYCESCKGTCKRPPGTPIYADMEDDE